MFLPPFNALGADLIWWRTLGGMRTRATLLFGRVQLFDDDLYLQAVLFDGSGQPLAQWRLELARDVPLFFDSDDEGPWHEAGEMEGILALYVCTSNEPSAEARAAYNRLFPLVDWRLKDGRIATLHSDQTIRRDEAEVQRLTEIVVFESAEERNALVFLNGEIRQPPGAVEVVFRNSSGDERRSTYQPAMHPFTAHRIEFAAICPGIAEFSGGKPLLVEASFDSRGLFSRPYVETVGKSWGTFHAGNVYEWSDVPYAAHALIGGEINPAAVWHDERTRTFVNLLHSHDGQAGDTAVDVSLFDLSGTRVAHRPAWRIAKRRGLARFDISELLDDPGQPFMGHIALRFAPLAGEAVPCRLQALIEYRRDNSVARVMTWSDEWNSRVRLAMRGRTAQPPVFRSFFTVQNDERTRTELAITNAGHEGYDRVAEVRASYLCKSGARAEARLLVPAHGTLVASAGELFAGSSPPLPATSSAVLMLESTSDLASIAFCIDKASGALAAEHFMALYSEHEGNILGAAGS